MRASGNSDRIAIMASMPFTSGSLRSWRVTSGLYLRKCSIASRPVETCATTCVSGWALMTLAIPSHRRGWSATPKKPNLGKGAHFRLFVIGEFFGSKAKATSKRVNHQELVENVRPNFKQLLIFGQTCLRHSWHSN